MWGPRSRAPGTLPQRGWQPAPEGGPGLGHPASTPQPAHPQKRLFTQARPESPEDATETAAKASLARGVDPGNAAPHKRLPSGPTNVDGASTGCQALDEHRTLPPRMARRAGVSAGHVPAASCFTLQGTGPVCVAPKCGPLEDRDHLGVGVPVFLPNRTSVWFKRANRLRENQVPPRLLGGSRGRLTHFGPVSWTEASPAGNVQEIGCFPG